NWASWPRSLMAGGAPGSKPISKIRGRCPPPGSPITPHFSRAWTPRAGNTPIATGGVRVSSTTVVSRAAAARGTPRGMPRRTGKACPQGPPYFTAASSFTGSNRRDPAFRLARALHVADWNAHDEAAVGLIHQSGGDWAFYNGGNRWTYGTYLYKAAKQFGLKF